MPNLHDMPLDGNNVSREILGATDRMARFDDDSPFKNGGLPSDGESATSLMLTLIKQNPDLLNQLREKFPGSPYIDSLEERLGTAMNTNARRDQWVAAGAMPGSAIEGQGDKYNREVGGLLERALRERPMPEATEAGFTMKDIMDLNKTFGEQDSRGFK